MRTDTVKNLLAAVGAVFLALIVLSLLIAYLSGKGPIGGGDKVAVVNLDGVTRLLRDGEEVTVDGTRGVVWVHA